MKGVLESIPEFFQVVIALAVAIILFAMIFQFSGMFKQTDQSILSGKKSDVAKSLAKLIEDCWRNNREGLSPDSAICKIIDIKSDQLVVELDVVSNLNCNFIPDNNCTPNNCGSCISNKYANQDKVLWEVSKNETKLKITYSGSDRIVEVKEVLP